ncbi:MAG: hypothetical protein K8U57_07375 [Planctomycetes bacterium]|nr:hypothetical protein [Planctomycetota bacterium]
MRVYLDQNIFMALLKGEKPGLREHIDAQKANGTVAFPYSPAHIEEVAVIFREMEDPELARARVVENLSLIGDVSGRWELLPGLGNVGPSRYVQETPEVCLGRVMEDYDLTLSAEENERFQMSFKSAAAFDQVQEEFGTPLRAGPGVPLHETKRQRHGIEVQRISNLSETAIFADTQVREGLEAKLWNYGWDLTTMPTGAALSESHKIREVVVNLVLAYLEEIGYRADAFEKYRSRMHDVTHAIYAAETDVFVTGDKRYRQRVKAAYSFLGISTKVLSIDEFMVWKQPAAS